MAGKAKGRVVDRCDVVVAGVVAVVTAASWLASITYNAERLEADSFVAGQRWAQLNAPNPVECETEMFRVSGPKVNGRTWLDGCLTVVTPTDR